MAASFCLGSGWCLGSFVLVRTVRPLGTTATVPKVIRHGAPPGSGGEAQNNATANRNCDAMLDGKGGQ